MNPLEDTVHGFTVQEVKKVLAAAEEAKNDEQVKLLQKVIREKRLQLLMRMRGLFEEAREAVAQ